MFPYFCSAKRSAASAASSNTKLVVWNTGTARAPVTGSGRAPAWMARVRNPHVRSLTMAGYARSESDVVLADAITTFLTTIGVDVVSTELRDPTLLPGLCIESGRLLFDRSRLT